MTFRFAVFAAVSSDEQVTDKDSLSKQIEHGRAFGERFGGSEACEPFVADGYSRSFYEGLSEAMSDIPPLRAAMLAAEQNRYDVLIVRYFERLGVVAYPVFLRLGKLKKQLRSVQESTPILPPEVYDASKDEATSTMIHLAGLKQDYRINRIINNLRDSMPKRIKDGLTPSRIPNAYIYHNNKQPPILDPQKGAKLIQAREMLISGESFTKISQVLGIHRSRVPTVLGNPYYMGQVTYNKTYIQRLGTKRTQVKLPKSKWTTGQGKHQPIFTPAEHDEILAELDRRERAMRRRDITHIFSGLLRCAVCGERVRRHKHGNPGKQIPVVVCRVAGAKHVRWDYDQFFDTVANEIASEMKRVQNGEVEEEDTSKADIIRQAIEKNKKDRVKIQQGYKDGIFTTQEASTELRELERENERLHLDLENATVKKVMRQDAIALMRIIDVDRVGEWLKDENPQMVNSILAAWFQEIQVGKKIKLIKR